tara:strand:+ start:72 stop:1100 length:1029 start_codon:yes stop_codon:yes gene_type:complete
MQYISSIKKPIKASLITDKNFYNNKIFEPTIRDNNSRKLIYLRNKFKKENIDLQTCDINLPEESNLSIHFDVNKDFLSKKLSPINILVARESPIINEYNNLKRYLNKFDLTLTWNKLLCDKKKILWTGYGNSSELIETDPIKIFNKKKGDLCTIISKKHSNKKNALYKQREMAIDFFANTDLNFDLYGFGWNRREFQGVLRPLNKISFARDFLYKPHSSYRGTVRSKAITFSEYKFSLCFENCEAVGYVTEKIFDSMFSGCIPIYMGCPNIKEEIDPNTFINFRDFSSYKDLYSYLKKMTKNEYIHKINNIIEFYKHYLKTTYCDQIWASDIVNKCLVLLEK